MVCGRRQSPTTPDRPCCPGISPWLVRAQSSFSSFCQSYVPGFLYAVAALRLLLLPHADAQACRRRRSVSSEA